MRRNVWNIETLGAFVPGFGVYTYTGSTIYVYGGICTPYIMYVYVYGVRGFDYGYGYAYTQTPYIRIYVYGYTGIRARSAERWFPRQRARPMLFTGRRDVSPPAQSVCGVLAARTKIGRSSLERLQKEGKPRSYLPIFVSAARTPHTDCAGGELSERPVNSIDRAR